MKKFDHLPAPRVAAQKAFVLYGKVCSEILFTIFVLYLILGRRSQPSIRQVILLEVSALLSKVYAKSICLGPKRERYRGVPQQKVMKTAPCATSFMRCTNWKVFERSSFLPASHPSKFSRQLNIEAFSRIAEA